MSAKRKTSALPKDGPRVRESEGGMGQRDYPDIWKAVRDSNFDLVQDILKKNPEMLNEQEVSTGLTPLHIAAVQCDKEIAQFLLAQEDLDGWIEDSHGRPIIALAYLSRDQEFIDLFRRRLLPDHMVEPPVSPAPSNE